MKELFAKFHIIKGSFSGIKLKHNNIKKNYEENFDKKEKICEEIVYKYQNIRDRILEKLKYKLEEKLKNLRVLNTSLIHSDRKDLDKYNEIYFNKLNVYDFNVKDSIDEIDEIELYINSK